MNEYNQAKKPERWRRRIQELNKKCINTDMSENEYLRKRKRIFELENELKEKEQRKTQEKKLIKFQIQGHKDQEEKKERIKRKNKE